MKKEIFDKTLEQAVQTSSQKNNSQTTILGKDPSPDSIFTRVQWERKSSDGTVIESGDSSKKVINPDKNKHNK